MKISNSTDYSVIQNTTLESPQKDPVRPSVDVKKTDTLEEDKVTLSTDSLNRLTSDLNGAVSTQSAGGTTLPPYPPKP